VSEGVLEALAQALQLDEAERAHLFDLARAASTTRKPQRRRPSAQLVRASVQLMLDAITDAPAFVRNGRLDVLAANRLGRAMYSEMYGGTARPANFARFLFLDDRSRGFYPDWERAANDTVAILRTEAGRDPYDRGLTDLVGELSTRSEEFRTRWAAHNVRLHYTGRKHFRHPVVGDLHLLYEALDPSAEAGLSLPGLPAKPTWSSITAQAACPPGPGRMPDSMMPLDRQTRRPACGRGSWDFVPGRSSTGEPTLSECRGRCRPDGPRYRRDKLRSPPAPPAPPAAWQRNR